MMSRTHSWRRGESSLRGAYMLIEKCSCGSTRFLMATEKLYRGDLEDKILRCEAYCQDVTAIECRECGKIYTWRDFKEIDY
jgi:hypothetical protein